jgi:hypothetical protein
MTLTTSPILMSVPRTPEVRLEIAKAIRKLAEQHDERQCVPGVEVTKVQSQHELAAEIVLEAWKLLQKAGYDPNEPRVPAGNPDGGQWTTDGGNGNSTTSSGDADEGDANPSSGARLAMEPKDPVTGEPLFLETPINRLGGGGGGGGGANEPSSPGTSAAAAVDTQGAGPPQIGSFSPPENLTFGTTLFGNYAHEQTAAVLRSLYPDVSFRFMVLPGQQGIDVTVLADPYGQVGYQYGEIKPLTASGESAFNRKLEQWGVGPVQAITYDADGNVYYGFR